MRDEFAAAIRNPATVRHGPMRGAGQRGWNAALRFVLALLDPTDG